MSFQKKTWAAGTVTKQAHVTINGTDYYVTPETRTGATALIPDDMNRIEQGIADNQNSIANIISVTTNDNGTAIKFSNGIMICLGKISTQMGASNTWDKLDNVYGKEITGPWNFPVAFKSIFALVGGVDGSDTAVWEAGVKKTLTAITGIKVRYNAAPNYYGLKFEYIAIGTWK